MGQSGRAAAAVLAALAALATAAALDDEMAELAQMVRDSCAGESGVDLALVERVNAGADLDTLADPVLRCYIKCTMETTGMMADGVVEVEAVLALLPDELRHRSEAALRACGSPQGADPCETAYLAQVCWQRANKADYFLI